MPHVVEIWRCVITMKCNFQPYSVVYGDVKCACNLHFNMACNFSASGSQRRSEIASYFNNPRDWSYRCEGSWIMAVSHSKMRVVLRLKKRESGKKSLALEERDYLRETFNNLDFVKHVISPLIGDDYVHVGEVISVPEGFASAINEICRGQRPQHRLGKEVDDSCSFGVIMPDFCFLPRLLTAEGNSRVKEETRNPTFSVEIKPKCGFLPTSPHIDPSRAIKYSVCHFCMLQKSKVKEGKFKRQSKYCPLDLFSADPGRVMFALECLVSDPQNNLRVFCNGEGIFTEELVQEAIEAGRICCAENFCEVVFKKVDGFSDWVMAGHKSEDCVTKVCHFENNCVNLKGHKAWDGVIKECDKIGESATMEGQKHENAVTKQTVESEVCMTRDRHQCGCVGPFTKQFLSILLEILISDSKQRKFSPNQEALSPASQVCKGSEYHKSDHRNHGNLGNFHFGTGGVLKQLLSVQKLDDIDVEGIFQIYQQVASYFESNPGVRNSLMVDGPYTSRLWKSVASSTSGFPQHRATSSSEASNSPGSVVNPDLRDQNILHDSVLKICRFGIANTAKDCSVMIAFQKASNKRDTTPTVETTSGNVFCYNIDLVDLDPKEFDRVRKYYKDSKNAVNNFIEG